MNEMMLGRRQMLGGAALLGLGSMLPEIAAAMPRIDLSKVKTRTTGKVETLYKTPYYGANGMWLAPGEWGGPKDGEQLESKIVRYRTVGDMSCTGAVESEAATVADVIVEVAASRLTERGATRADDRLSEAAMEDRKREGYF